MDPKELRHEVDEWVDDDIVTREQAEEILARYDADESGYSRFVLALSMMGVTLLGAGVLWLLAEHWGSLSRLVRTLLVVLTPPALGIVSYVLTRERIPRVGHAFWVLAVVFTGVSLFLLADLWAPDLAAEWLLLAWATVALPAGHSRVSRPTTALGLLVLTAVVTTLESPADLPIAVGFVASILITLGIVSAPDVPGPLRFEPELGSVYRLVGTIIVVVVLLYVTFEEWTYDTIALEPTPVALATGGGAIAGVIGCWILERRGRLSLVRTVWTSLAVASVLVSGLLVSLVPPVPALLVVLAIHALLFAVLVGSTAVAVDTDSPLLLNLTAIAFLVQLLVFMGTTVLRATTGASALVIMGTVLVLAGIGLERGRRQLLERM